MNNFEGWHKMGQAYSTLLEEQNGCLHQACIYTDFNWGIFYVI